MNHRNSSSIVGDRFRFSALGWLEFAPVVLMIVVLLAIEPVSKAFVRNPIGQHAVDQRLSELADEIVVQSLLSRRFEKDILLNLTDQQARSTYQAQWTRAVAALERAIEEFHAAATTDSDREQAARWLAASRAYHSAALDTLREIDSGRVTEPAEANRLFEVAKSPIRTLTDTATTVAHAKRTAAARSGSTIRESLSASARIITLALLASCFLWLTVGRRQRGR